MEDQKIFKYNIFSTTVLIVTVVINVLFLKGIKSETYTVGDEDEWNSQANYGSWSQKYNFSTGDVLVFKYNPGQHNVYEVTRNTYQTCNASSGVLAEYKTGNDQITLTEAKNYWFICNFQGHCLGGMRFGIDVKQATNNTSSNSGPSAPPTSTPPTSVPTNYCRRFGFEIWHIGIYTVALFGLFFT